MKKSFWIATIIVSGLLTWRQVSLVSVRQITGPKSIDDLPERDRTAINVLKSIYAAPISVYGKVVDENGSPISGATVEYSLNDKYFKEGTKGKTTSDGSGAFKIKGNGVSVYISVQKTGYYRMPDGSYGSIRANQETSLVKPAVFSLKLAGNTESLTHISILTHGMPVNGTPKEINLASPDLVPLGQGHLRIEVWVDGPPTQGERYNNFPWHCRVSVSEGGMIERNDELSFIAPVAGYQPIFEVAMKSGEGWRHRVEKEMYLRLPNHTYARGHLLLSVLKEEALVTFESYWNQSGSRNLEAGANWFGKAN